MPFQPLPRDRANCIVMCRACGARRTVYKQQLGLPLPCPACGVVAAPRYMGTTAAGSGCQVTFGSFRKLLDVPRLLRRIEDWLALRHIGGEHFVDAEGQDVPLEDIHFAVQSVEAWQGEVYSLSMSRAR